MAVITTVLVIASSLTAYGAYHDIYGNINQETIDTDAMGERPEKIEGVINILMTGSDVRSGANAEYGGDDIEGERPDTIIIAHISPDHGATLVNLPRDSLLQLPACSPIDDKEGYAAHQGVINSTVAFGGMQCLWKTVEELTGIRLDHFVSVDFTGFIEVVEALGGVEMCIPEPISDPKAHLELDAGQQVLDGEQSLGYVRSRYGQGDGSDLSRIKRQQDFMGAMLRKATSSEILASPANLHDFLGSVTDSITTDDELTLERMVDIAITMRETKMSDIRFITVPNGLHPDNENRVAWSEPDASQLFAAIAADKDLSSSDDEDGESDDSGNDDSGDSSEDDTATVEPAVVSVEVINGEGTPGLASDVGSQLTERGFQVVGAANPQGTVPEQTTVYYGTGHQNHAQTLADELATATTAEDPTLGSTVKLVISNDWNGLSESEEAVLPDSTESKTAEKQTNACS
ncbi:LCP family protein [Salinactinospora qingdaonensis]|uniref:Transcriptional attenuator, LytR family n=1 Tax=Salinactinospora qingdaonensis TaxID=702744 RepID=A0ABP7FZE2_9ACTN